MWELRGWAASGQTQSLSVLSFLWEGSPQRGREGGLAPEAAPLWGDPSRSCPAHLPPPTPLTGAPGAPPPHLGKCLRPRPLLRTQALTGRRPGANSCAPRPFPLSRPAPHPLPLLLGAGIRRSGVSGSASPSPSLGGGGGHPWGSPWAARPGTQGAGLGGAPGCQRRPHPRGGMRAGGRAGRPHGLGLCLWVTRPGPHAGVSRPPRGQTCALQGRPHTCAGLSVACEEGISVPLHGCSHTCAGVSGMWNGDTHASAWVLTHVCGRVCGPWSGCVCASRRMLSHSADMLMACGAGLSVPAEACSHVCAGVSVAGGVSRCLCGC